MFGRHSDPFYFDPMDDVHIPLIDNIDHYQGGI